MTYAKGLSSVPYPLGTPEWDSFKNWVKAYYKEAIQIAKESSSDEVSYRTLLNATISPLVFLWEKWQLMTSQQRLTYATPEYKTILEERIKEVEKTTQKAEEMKR